MESERTEVLAPVAPVPAANPDARGAGRVGRIISIVAVILAFVVLVFGVLDWIARTAVQTAISQAFIDATELPSTQRVETEISGLVLPQLLVQSLDRVTISSQNVNVAGGAADVSVVVDGLSLGDQPAARGMRGDLRIDAGQLTYMAGAGAMTFGFDGPDATASMNMSAGGRTTSVGVAFIPGFSGGAVTLAFSSVRLGETELTVDDLRAQYGEEASAALQPQALCIASELPGILRVTSVGVEGQALVARFAVDTTALDTAALAVRGTCA